MTNKLSGTWQLSETYISPGGATEWVTVADGYRYIFDSYGTFKMIANDNTLQKVGRYRVEENELFLEFELDGKQTTLGYRLELTDSTMTLSPSFPVICIEACLYRFKRK